MKDASKDLKDQSAYAQVKAYFNCIAPKYSTDTNWKSEDPYFLFAKHFLNSSEKSQ
jgi:hypothetical protein